MFVERSDGVYLFKPNEIHAVAARDRRIGYRNAVHLAVKMMQMEYVLTVVDPCAILI
ncbi:MAG: hypothetical protein LJE66_03760 [Desulfobacterales bacterium]|jgi:hypothetical protein|nr:hypothetical protein [Desulfobacterales bacterium]